MASELGEDTVEGYIVGVDCFHANDGSIAVESQYGSGNDGFGSAGDVKFISTKILPPEASGVWYF